MVRKIFPYIIVLASVACSDDNSSVEILCTDSCGEGPQLNQSHYESLIETNVCESCDLFFADFSGMDLSGANISGSRIGGANFSNAILVGADLSQIVELPPPGVGNPSFENADLTNADLAGSNLTGFLFLGATLENVDLSDSFLCNTTMPDGSIEDRDCS